MSFGKVMDRPGLWNTALKEFEQHGIGCQMIKDLIYLFTLPVVEARLDQARQRRAEEASKEQVRPTYKNGREHYQTELERKQDQEEDLT